MCKSKKSTSVIQPRTRTNTKRTNSPRPHRTRTPTSSSSNYETSTRDVPITESRSYVFENNNNSNTNYDFEWSKTSSISSRASLSSLRDTLPENPNIYHFSEIAAATANFSSPRLSSSSWRCVIRQRDVVVSRRNFRQQIDLPELSRRLALICRSHHSSLVKLLGASVSGAVIFLVYEFVPGASLADCLRNRRNPSFTDLKTWISRMQIASDVAHGLDYIHNFSGSGSDSEAGFVHNHIKISSIVITEENLRAKICHFGASDLCGEAVAGEGEPSGGRMVRIEGRRGYMAPEFQISGLATKKTDVYAFGVVVLELLSGEEALKFEFNDDGGYRRISVVETAKIAAEVNGGVRKWADKRLRDSFPVKVAERMLRVGLECVCDDPNERPDMGRVSNEVSKLYLESKEWDEKMGTDIDLSVSLAPR
ncbi:hypothetical protein AAZX31_20G168100 [Glycine max]|uniref:Protein kinase domain-containing protein n=1 Tax=Glycine max TaxID=3847 RepID=I1NHH1_SOYBN|nr:lysM domain receptor-like kinase 3 [Glycine max]KAG4908107.1 hypothetical protein JHK86_056591 [Glycine max]KAG4919322.1 hypothetical protein JHK85_057603 [Glycine max]KAG5078065.1 hypothetical protein JHK82_056760 [Glycine max]KAH1036728.1 hypothetical protein GYH30_056246 [Glycine max]KAH1191449.1 LysM domain receptor-like kinase 3 [Glycine max]|eukprot:XP_003555440.1 lysM domain receptor-like kinase 3 [Glycine max]